MARNRIIYQEECAFVGPWPNFSGHWIMQDGTLKNDTGDYNLLNPILRVQDISYSINFQRTDIKQLGKRGVVDKVNLLFPTFQLDINYLQFGVYNERNIGFYVNYPEIYGPNQGLTHFPNTLQTFLLSGFINRNYNFETLGAWPYATREPRNIFIGLESAGVDFNSTFLANVHPDAKTVPTLAFGNCYLTKYQSQAAVGNFPQASVSFICENVASYSSGYNIPIPMVFPISGNSITGVYATLPTSYQGTGILSVVRPGDITLNINSSPALTGVLAIQGTGVSGGFNSKIFDLGTNFTDIKIQSYSLLIDLPRRSLDNLGFRLPLDRELVFPVNANLNIDMIVGDSQTGSLERLLSRDDEYNFTILLKNPIGSKYPGYAVRYDVLRSKLESISYRSQIQGQKTASFGFSVELDPDDYSKGLFISGNLNTDPLNLIGNISGTFAPGAAYY